MLAIRLLGFSFLAMIAGCASLTPEQQAKLADVDKFPLEFRASKPESVDAWGRAQSFIGRFSSMQIQIATDYAIQTYVPPDTRLMYGYNVTKTPAGEDVSFEVQCFCGNILGTGHAVRNAHILAYYMKTGELVEYGISRIGVSP